MALDAVDICNLALTRVGIAQQVAAIDPPEESIHGRVCALWYPACRDMVLRDFPWPFATRYRSLGLLDEDPPNDEWDYHYAYPTDCLRALRIVNPSSRDDSDKIPFEVSSIASGSAGDGSVRVIFTDEADAVLKYIAAITDPTSFSPDFASALAWRIAAEISDPLSVQEARRERCERMYHDAITRAQASALNEGGPDPEADSSFITARR